MTRKKIFTEPWNGKVSFDIATGVVYTEIQHDVVCYALFKPLRLQKNSEKIKHYRNYYCELQMTVEMGFPLGMEIPWVWYFHWEWDFHGNGTNIESVVGMKMGTGKRRDLVRVVLERAD